MKSKLALIAQIGVLEAEEVEHAVEADGVDRLLGIGYDTGLGVEGDAEASFRDHGEVVGTITHGDGLREVHLLYLGDERMAIL